MSPSAAPHSLIVIRKKLRSLASKEKSRILQGFFKTGPQEYAEGDKFIGVQVPDTRRIAEECSGLGEKEILELLRSPIHEERLLALLVLIKRFGKAGGKAKARIYRLYLENYRHINNWDLVDLSAHKIVGAFLSDKSKEPLYELAESENIWQRRIAMISTFGFIKEGEFAVALKIAGMLLSDKEDLIHKATGWMLREIGKRDLGTEELFLSKHAGKMPRTMLRYAIEKFPLEKRRYYLAMPREQRGKK
jgi:3-methyladenine DNA glycosylase AlkD